MSSPGDSKTDLDFGPTLRGFAANQRVFDRYELREILGRGGMGVVWRAYDEQLECEVALKFLPEMVAFDEQAVADLKRETRKTRELRHHHIVQVYDFVTDKRSACISMECVDGPTLSAIKARKESGCMEVDEISEWVKQLCEALSYAHERAKIVHRDLKPANLMINGKSELKVTDFGIARSVSDSVSMLTMARGTSGTLVYMSPQQLDGERTSHLDDIYSLGATLFELLTSRPPFYSGGVERQIHEKTPPPIAQRRGELGIGDTELISNEWEQTIAACLAKDPAQRPQSAGEIAYRLGVKGVGNGPTRPPAPTVPSAMGAPPQRINVPAQPAGKSPSRISTMGLAFAVGGFAILLGGLGTYVAMRQGTPSNVVITTPMTPNVASSIATASPSVASADSAPIPTATAARKEIATSPKVATPLATPPSPNANGSDTAGSDQGLTKFTNQKYACTVLVPLTVFTNPPQQLDDEHTTFLSADGRTQLQLIVQENPQNRPIADIYREWIVERTKGHSSTIVNYKILKGNWFVLSGDADGRGYYVKCVARDRKLFSMNLEYDEEMGVIWQDTMTTMSRSFSGGILP